MNARAKAKLAAALRSGKFTKGQGAERRTLPDGSQTYCVIGVLGCVWAAAQGVPVDSVFSPRQLVTQEALVRPLAELRAWADVSNGELDALIRANDDDESPKSFAEIAAIVEAL